MTMLDRMRRHKNWLKWSLAIVVVAFVLLYIPNFLRNGGMGGASGVNTREVVASVDGRDITVGQFRKIYNQQMQAYRRSYGGSIDERLLKQMGIDRRILQQLIDEEAGLAEARRLGITTSDEEVRARILALPAFQENGQFIGDGRYRQLLQMADPPRRPSEFEEEVRRSMTLSKLQGRPVVLAFFPAAFSSVCTKELCTFKDSMAQLGKANAQVFGISVDTFFALKAFQDQQKLTFPLLSDFNKTVIRDYGVFNEDMIGLKGIAKRATFVIDKDGIVRHAEVLEDARNEPSYDAVFKALGSL